MFCCEPLCSRHTILPRLCASYCLKTDPEWPLRCVPFPHSISGAVSGGSTLFSVLTLVKFELVAMMVLALLFAATELECGLAPLEHGLLCGLAHVGLGPCQCAATPVLPCVEFVGAEMVSGTPGAGVCACVVATETEKVICFSQVALSGIFKVSEWEAAAMMLSVGCMFMDSGDFPEFPHSWMFCEDAENMRSSCDCGFLRGEDSCSQDCSVELACRLCMRLPFSALHWRHAFSARCCIAYLVCVASSISRRLRACVKCMGKDYKGEKELNCFLARKISLESAELEEGQESSIDISWEDVRNAVVTECPENQLEAGAAFGTLQVPVRKTGSRPVWSKHPVFRQKGRRCSDAGGQERKV